MNGKKWYEKKFRRLLVDMHIPDWDESMLRDFSPGNYAEMMKLANIDVAEVAACSNLGLCHWPTDCGVRHKQLNGRDLLGDTIKACHRQRLEVQIYLCVWNRIAHDLHPEWRVIFPDGKSSVENGFWNGRYGLCCLNTGFSRYFLTLLDEINSRYDFLGFWIDMPSLYTICHCPACKQRFTKESGYKQYPQSVDWNDEHFLALQECRRNWLAEFMDKICRTVKKSAPERTVTFQSGSLAHWFSGLSGRFPEATEFLASDQCGDNIELSEICKLWLAMSPNRPIEFMLPRCEQLEHHTTERSFGNLLMRSYSALANQAALTLIDAIDPSGTLDRRFYEHAGKVNAEYRRYEEYISGNSRPLAVLAYYFNFESQIDTDMKVPLDKAAEAFPKHYLTRQNLITFCTNRHLLFAFTKQAEPLERFPVLILNECSHLSDDECAAITEYVENGGKLYASYHSSLYDPRKGHCSDFRLAHLFGVHYEGQTEPLTYISPTPDSFLNAHCSEKYPVMLDSAQVLVRADSDTEILGTLTLPCSTREETVHFGSANSNPPMKWTKYPALVRHKFGKGKVIYCAGKLEEPRFEFHRRIFDALLRSLEPERIIETSAPGTVEITVFDQPEQRRLVISLLNLLSELPQQPACNDIDLTLTLPSGYEIKRLLLAPAEEDIPFKRLKNKRISFSVRKLNEFAMYILEYSEKTTPKKDLT